MQRYGKFSFRKILSQKISIFVSVKRSIILLVALIIGILHSFGQETPAGGQNTPEGRSPLRFEISEWDFGDIREDGGSVSHVFAFTNEGATPTVIDRVVASCGCTTSAYLRRPVAAGERASITVTFDPMGYPGSFSKSIAVVSGGGKQTDFLVIKGRVIPRARSVAEEYPYDIGGGVRFGSTLAAFRTVPQGSSAASVIKWANTSDKAVTFALQPVESSGLLMVHAPERLCAGCRGDITLLYDLSNRSAYGIIHDVLRPVIDGVPATTTVYASMTGIDDFTEVDADSAPKFVIDGPFHNFGEVRRRTVPYTYRLVATNGGATELHIRSVEQAAGFKTTLRAGMTIAPGASLPFEVMLYTDKYYTGALNESIIMVVDDPLRPVREIRATATIK